MRKVLLLLILAFLTTFLSAQTYDVLYGGTGAEDVYCVQATNDGGAVLCGYTSIQGLNHALIMRLDAQGDTLWTRAYAYDNVDNVFYSIIVCANGDIVAAGATSSGNQLRTIVNRLDPNGNLIWNRVFTKTGFSYHRARTIVEVSPGNGFYLSCITEFFVGGTCFQNDVTYISDNGTISSGTGLDHNFCELIGKLVRTTDGFTYSSGDNSLSFGGNQYQPSIGHYDTLGGTSWLKIYEMGSGTLYDINRTNNGYFSGGDQSQSGQSDVFLLRTDNSGNIQNLVGYSHTQGRDIRIPSTKPAIFMGDTAYIVAITDVTNPVNTRDFGAALMDKTGNTIWYKAFGGIQEDQTRDVVQAADGGFIIVGRSNSFSGSYDIYIRKVDSLGNVNVTTCAPDLPQTLTAQALNPIIHTPNYTTNTGFAHTPIVPIIRAASPAQTSCFVELEVEVDTLRTNCLTVDFSADVNGGEAPYTYEWFGFTPNPGNVSDFSYTFPSVGTYNYSVIVTDNLGDKDTLVSTITLQNNSIADAGLDLTICSGQNTQIGTSALAGYSYQWSSIPAGTGFTGATNVAQPNIAPTSSTNTQISYIVSATDSYGCTANDTMVLTLNAALQGSVNVSSAICVGQCTQFQYTGNAPVGAVYVWNFGGGTLQNGPAVGAGPYTVCYNNAGTANVSLSVQVLGCDTATYQLVLPVSASPSATFTLAPGVVCLGAPIVAQYTGGANTATHSFLWDFDGGTAFPGGNVAGPHAILWGAGNHTVELIVISPQGCADTTTQNAIVSALPQAGFSMPDSVCVGDNVQITDTANAPYDPNAVYAWDFDGGIVVSGAGGPTPQVYWTSPGTYQVCVQVTSPPNCQSGQYCQTIEVMPAPVASIAQVSNQCFNGNSFDFTYTGTSGIDAYYWDFGDGAMPPFGNMANPTNIVYTTDGPKEVTLVVVKNGCVSDTARVNFLVAPMPHADFIAGSVGACLGDTIGFHYVGPTVTPNLQVYSWDFGPCSNPVSSSLQNPGAVQFNCAGPQTITLIVDNLGCKDTMTQTIQIHAGPIVDAGLPQSYCEGEGPADLNGSVSGGTQPWFYSWWCAGAVPCALSSPYVEDPQANPTASNLYYFQVEDANGCRSNIDTVTVQIKEKPIVDAGRDTAVCKPAGAWGVTICGEVVNNGTVPGPYTWEWTPLTGIPGQNNTQCIYIRPDTTTTYTLVVTAGNGCTSYWPTLDSLSTVTVLVHNMPIVEAGPDSMICMGETIQLLGNVTGAGPDYTYAWTPSGYPGNVVPANALNPNATPAFTTTYTLSATSNGCTASDTMRIVVRNLPTAEAGDILEICQGQSIQLNGVCAGDPYPGAECNQSWTVVSGDLTALPIPNDVFNPTVSPNVTTVYELTVSSERCQGTSDQVTVQVFPYPQVNVLDDDTLICAGVSVDLEGTHVFAPNPSPGPVVYHWYPSDNTVSDVFSPTPTVTPVQSTMYVLEVSTAGKCPGRDSVRISVMPAINASILADTTTICGGESTVLHAQGGLGSQQWTWTPALGLDKDDIKDPTATPPAGSTTYQVVIQEGFCKDSAQVTITVHPQPSADYFSTNQQACDNMEVSFLEMAENEIAYIWNFGDNSPVDNTPNPTHTYSQPGTYYPTLTVIGKGGCSDQVNVGAVTVTDLRFANFISNPDTSVTIVLPDGKVVFTDLSTQGTSWSWDFGDGKVSGERNPTHEYTAAGEYTVTLTVTNADGCVDKVVKTPYKVIAPGLFTPNVFTPNGDGIHDTWQIGYNGVERFAVVVYDRWGRKHFEADSPTKSWDGKDAKEGVYYYTIKVGDKVWNGYVTLMR